MNTDRSARWLAGLLGVGVLVAASSSWTNPALGQVAWRSPEASESLTEDVATMLAAFAAGDPQYFVIAFEQGLTSAQRQRLGAAGLRLGAYLGKRTFFARLEVGSDVEGVLAGAPIATCYPIESAWKVHPAFRDGAFPEYAVADADPQGLPIVACYVVFHDDSLRADRLEALRRHGAKEIDTLVTLPVIVAHVPVAAVVRLAGEDVVQWVEPPLPPLEDVNDSNRSLTQANVAQALPYDLDGSGVQVLVYDGGVALESHADFGGRLTVRDGAPTVFHATHVSGTVGGDGTVSTGLYRGMAPGVTIESYGIQLSGGGIPLHQNPGDFEADYADAMNNFGVDIANNSIGTNTATNGFPCDITGDYGVMSGVIDSVVRGGLGRRMRIVWANGNERQVPNCGDLYNTTAPPATAKNHIAVGAINSNDESMTSFSSWGPVDDGRLRPDVTAPGCQSGGDNGVTSTNSDGMYGVACGTSMAAPTVTGLCALLLQEYRMLRPSEGDPDNASLKAVLAHTAVDLGQPGPDYQFGYGSVRVVDSIDFLATGSLWESQLQQGESLLFTVVVPPGSPELRITLAWDDAPGTPNVVPALVNDLDLVVTGPGGAPAYPWTLDPADPGAPATQSQADHTNNLEQVLVLAPAPGVWQIAVTGTDVPEGPQRFSVAATPTATGVFIQLPEPLPTRVAPGVSLDFEVHVRALGEGLIPGTPVLVYSLAGGASTVVPLAPLGGARYLASLPGATCGASPSFSVRAEGTLSGQVWLPASAPTETFTFAVEEEFEIFVDDFETDLGWTAGVIGDDATAGQWVRVDPIGTGAQPEDDHSDPGSQCFVTGQGSPGGGLGEADVDGGTTTLLSPIFDLNGADDAMISYWRWFSNAAGAGANTETFTVDVSANGGLDWTNVETIGPSGPGTTGGWILNEFRLGDIVAATSQVQFRFVTQDPAPGSLVEAALDDFAIRLVGCTNDCNGNQIDDAGDIAAGTSADLNGNGLPDECECSTPLFVRGDANYDFSLDLSDAVAILGYLFGAGPLFAPLEASDVNADDSVNLADPLALLGFLLQGGSAPVAPFPAPGCGD